MNGAQREGRTEGVQVGNSEVAKTSILLDKSSGPFSDI